MIRTPASTDKRIQILSDSLKSGFETVRQFQNSDYNGSYQFIVLTARCSTGDYPMGGTARWMKWMLPSVRQPVKSAWYCKFGDNYFTNWPVVRGQDFIHSKMTDFKWLHRAVIANAFLDDSFIMARQKSWIVQSWIQLIEIGLKPYQALSE